MKKNEMNKEVKDIFHPGIMSVDEQETHIHYMRDEEFATVYTSDTTQVNRLNKLCGKSDNYSLIASTKYGNTYKIDSKDLVSLRSAKIQREMSEEQRQAASDRFRKLREERKEERKSEE